MERTFLHDLYASSKILECRPLAKIYSQGLESQTHLDDIWAGIHLLISQYAAGNGDKFSVDLNSAHEEILRLDQDLAQNICRPQIRLDRILLIADSIMEEIPNPYPGAKAGYAIQALEATLWRAFDALKATQVLHRESLLAACHIELRAAQEAILLHNYFTRKPSKAKVVKIANYWEEIEFIAAALRHQETLGRIDQDLRKEFDSHIAELAKLHARVTVSPDWKPEITCSLANSPKWFDIIDAESVHPAFKSNPRIAYADIFLLGNRSAHCLAPFWNGYIKDIEGKPQLQGSVKGNPIELGHHWDLTLYDFISCLAQKRPALKANYRIWVRICMERSWMTIPRRIERITKPSSSNV